MNIEQSIRQRLGARAISDVEISDTLWKPDFDIADRYQNFANELMRIALLGIAAYGFLIKEVYMKDVVFQARIIEDIRYFIMGSAALGISLSLALAHRFLSTSCLYYQVLIMRSLKRLENAHWTNDEKEREKIFLADMRIAQRRKSRLGHIILISSSIFFAVGFLFAIFTFYTCFHRLPKG